MDAGIFWHTIKNTCRHLLRSKWALIITVLLLIWLGRRYLRKRDEDYYKIKYDFTIPPEVPDLAPDKAKKKERKWADETEFEPQKTDYGWYEGGFRHLNKLKDSGVKLKDLSSWSMRYKNMAVYSIKGRRPYMEDRFNFVTDESNGYQLFGLFDGHGGTFVAEYAEEKLLQNVAVRLAQKSNKLNLTQLFIEETTYLDADFMRIQYPNLRFIGSTALFAYLQDKDLYVGNVGDCRAVGVSFSTGKVSQLTVDHKPNNKIERTRIEKAGGTVAWNGVWRLGGILAVSRALGDLELKKPGWLTAEPDIFRFNLKQKPLDLLILASDGFWDVFQNDQIVELLKPYYFDINGNKINDQSASMQRLLDGAKFLVEMAYQRGSSDNITVMIVKL